MSADEIHELLDTPDEKVANFVLKGSKQLI